MRVLDFGSLNIDTVYEVDHFVKKGETLQANTVNTYPGGKGLNQAIALARAGAPVVMAGVVGDDGDFLLNILRTSGVDTSKVMQIKNVNTGHAIIQNDTDGDNCILLNPGANYYVSEEMADEILNSFEEGDILLMQNEINLLDSIIQKAKKKNMKVFLNPAPMKSNIFDLDLNLVDCMIVNETEAQALLKNPVSNPTAILNEYIKEYPNSSIVLTLSDQGAWYKDKDQTLYMPAFPVKALDSTGAGDTFTGNFIAGLLKNDSVLKAMEQAAAAAAISVQRKGAASSIPLLEETETFRNSHPAIKGAAL